MQTITILAEQVGPLGITLGAPGDMVAIPIVDAPRFDERQTCHLVHDYLSAHDYAETVPAVAASDLPAYRTCSSYCAGRCRGGHQVRCLFEEPATAAGWVKARAWRRLPSGALCPAEDYQEYLAHERTWARAAHTDRQGER